VSNSEVDEAREPRGEKIKLIEEQVPLLEGAKKMKQLSMCFIMQLTKC
jgi:hypothetical protein